LLDMLYEGFVSARAVGNRSCRE